MFETLSKGFRAARDRLSGATDLTEDNIDQALRDVRISLLEADVEFKVTKRFLARVKEKALGQTVKLRVRAQGKKAKVSPGDHFVRICQDELAALMGPVDTSIQLAKKGASAIMMVGLQGSGKTTTTGKLARHLEKQRKRPLLVAADVYRPAAIDQLKVLGKRLNIPVYSDDSGDPVGICDRAMQEASRTGRDVVIFDTAGRLAIDEPLMQELEEIKLRTRPANIFLVVDSMMGQDSVNTAKSFHQRLDISGVILTKLDGDARGGAALSIKEVTGAPIKFLGIGESLDKLEEFRPEGLASRILGMGDIVGLMKDFEDVVDAESAEKEAIGMLQGQFDMQDFLKQVKTIQKMGSLSDLFDKLPFFPNGLPDGMVLDDRELVKIEAMINSMTKSERSRPDLFIVMPTESGAKDKKGKPKEPEFNESRIRRVARGAGREENDVKELINKFATMREMMMSIGQQSGLLGKIPGIRQLSQMKQLAGMDMEKFMSTMGLPGGPGGEGMPGMPEPKRKFRPPQSSASRAKAKRKRKLARKSRKR
ncbi:MAG: signal recognition particle protein [Proteobacteria bacterium]|nr:MAG: signal recognition particle protein [Pseudomonadota bacterium]PIE19612.1 MAG: signal recognition particle protein [Pseudomonadota bacterium]